MSSRLFQKIREERGKAYTVYAFHCPFREIGYSGVYAATTRNHVAEVAELVFEELRDVMLHGLHEDELERTKRQMIGALPLALESTESRMFRIARNLLYFDRPVPLDELIGAIRRATNEEVLELARDIFSFERAGAALLGDAEENMISLPLA